jgi:hypothetical protein
MAANQAGLQQQVMMPSQKCIAEWVQLEYQLSPFNVIVAIDEGMFRTWNHVDQQYIMSSYM